jgi:hypothetical protein
MVIEIRDNYSIRFMERTEIDPYLSCICLMQFYCERLGYKIQGGRVKINFRDDYSGSIPKMSSGTGGLLRP